MQLSIENVKFRLQNQSIKSNYKILFIESYLFIKKSFKHSIKVFVHIISSISFEVYLSGSLGSSLSYFLLIANTFSDKNHSDY